MRISAIALAATSTAAASLLFMAPAHASTVRAADPADLPTYTCLFRGPAPFIYPAILNGIDCRASNGAPTEGSAEGPLLFRFLDEPEAWICERADADRYPERVIGLRCVRAGEGDGAGMAQGASQAPNQAPNQAG